MIRMTALSVLLACAGAASADTINLNLNAMPVGPIQGGPDGRAPGNGQWWLPDNAATSGEVRAGVGFAGGNGLVVGNRGNGNDGVIDNLHTPKLNEMSGESSVPGAVHPDFLSSFMFRTASATPVSGLTFKAESWGRDRTTWLAFYEDGGDLKANYSGVIAGAGGPNDDVFTDNIYAGTLVWGAWYRVDTLVQFVDGANNDVVTVSLYDSSNALVHTWNDTTWENYYRQDSEQGPNGNQITGVDALQFQARGSPTGDVAFVDNISYASVPAPGAAALMGIAGLVGLRRRR